jgi:hypothetical protein
VTCISYEGDVKVLPAQYAAIGPAVKMAVMPYGTKIVGPGDITVRPSQWVDACGFFPYCGLDIWGVHSYEASLQMSLTPPIHGCLTGPIHGFM